MECKLEKLQFLGRLGIFREAARILRSQRPLLGRVAAAFVLPLSALSLARAFAFGVLFLRVVSDGSALSLAPAFASDALFFPVASALYTGLHLHNLVYLYLIAHLFLSPLSTAAVVFAVASRYSGKGGLSFRRVLGAPPRVWCRLVATTVAAAVALVAHIFALGLFLLHVLSLTSNGGAFVAVLAVAYFAVLVYTVAAWSLAGVVTVLEDTQGFVALLRSSELTAGKFGTTAAIVVKLELLLAMMEVAFGVVAASGGRLGVGPAGRLALGLVLLVALCGVQLFALVVQAVLYFVCKSYHGEGVEKSELWKRLAVFLGEDEPLSCSDVQTEGLQV